MFINCDKKTAQNSQNFTQIPEKCLVSSINWSSTTYPAKVSAHTNISAGIYGKSGFAATGSPLTIEFFLEVVFTGAEIYGGSNGIAVFYLKNSIVKTLSGTSFTEKIKCDKIIFTFSSGALSPVIYQDCYAVSAENFNYTTGETNFQFLSENGTFNGSEVIPTSGGLIKFYFPLKTVIYRAEFTGKIFLYNPGLIYEDTVLCYSQEVSVVAFDTSVSLLVYRRDDYQEDSFIIETFDYPRGYANVRNQNFYSNGLVMDTNVASAFGTPNTSFGGPGIGAGGSNNSVYLGKALYSGGTSEIPNPGGNFSITFRKNQIIKYLKFIGSGTFTFSGITVTIPNFGDNHYYLYETPFSAESIAFSGPLVLAEMSYNGELFNKEIPQTLVVDFNEFSEGEIFIKNKYFSVSTSDMINHPPIILDSTTTPHTEFGTPNVSFGGPGVGAGGSTGKPGENSISRGKVLVYSDNTAKSVLPGSGTLNFTFTKKIYVYSISFLNSTGSFLDYTISDYGLNSIQTIFIKQYLDTLSITLDGAIVNLVLEDFYEENPSRFLYVADLSTPVPEFTFTAFDTNIANQYGTPNTSFGGPGVGAGGAAGPGQNNIYRGNATLSTLNFSAATYVSYIDIVNSELGNNLVIDGTTIYTGNYGTNSVYRLNIKKKIQQIIPNNVAILEISYQTERREIVTLYGNSATPVNLTLTSLTGNYFLRIQGLNSTAFSNIFIVKAVSTNAGSILTQAAEGSALEKVDSVWPITGLAQIYFRVLPGINAPYYFVVYYV